MQFRMASIVENIRLEMYDRAWQAVKQKYRTK